MKMLSIRFGTVQSGQQSLCDRGEKGKMYLIVGLGNPGAQYSGTRHNAGFMVLDALADKHRISVDTKKHKGFVGKGMIGAEKVILLKPQTFMNLSGESVREAMDFYKIDPENVLVIYDDISLKPGQLRLRSKGSAGGHNGIKNIILHMKTQEFPRVKVGVGEKPPRMDLVDHVLGHFQGEDKKAFEASIPEAVNAVEVFLAEGMDVAMNRFNAKK